MDSKKQAKKSPPKAQAKQDDFDFGFDQPSKPQQTSGDFFDFGNQPQAKKGESAFDDFGQEDLIQPKKPTFDDYFPEEKDSDDDDGTGDTGLISNLKKLYKKDGLIPDSKKKEDPNMLKPQIPDALRQDKFIPEVAIKGEGFWEERKNPQLAYQKVDYSHFSAFGPGQQNQVGYGQMGQGQANLHISKSSNALSPPTEFPNQPYIGLPINRSHSSDSSTKKQNQEKGNKIFGDLYKTSIEKV